MQNKIGQVRVGRCIYDNTLTRNDPTFPGFTNIVVLKECHSEWGVLGPISLKDSNGRIFINIIEFSKVYHKIPKTEQYSLDKRLVWDHPAETHVNMDGTLTNEYFAWRKKGMENVFPIRFSSLLSNKSLYSLAENKSLCHDLDPYQCLTYKQARKHIYLKEYIRLVKDHPKFFELKERLCNGENLLIIDLDGPHQESLDYYIRKYKKNMSFIERGSCLATKENLEVFLNDTTHSFGHGFCLAAALLDLKLT